MADRWSVEIEPGVWLAPWSGDPGRTLVAGHARLYATEREAMAGLAAARRYRPFKAARVVAVHGRA